MSDELALNDSQREAVRGFGALLQEEGLHAALAFLNARSGHRFTGIYRFDPPTLRNVHLFDSANPALEVTDDAPLRETYCSLVGDTAAPFATGDSRADERLAEHPARETTLAYCGVPLTRPDGTPFGTLCHFDVVPRRVRAGEIPVMQGAGTLIMQALPAGAGAG